MTSYKCIFLITFGIWTITAGLVYLLSGYKNVDILLAVGLLGFCVGFFVSVILCVIKNTASSNKDIYRLYNCSLNEQEFKNRDVMIKFNPQISPFTR